MTRHVSADDPNARLFAAIGHPVRLDMLRELAAAGEVCGCGFRTLGTVKQPTISHHLRVLREAGLVTCKRERAYLMYRLDTTGLERLGAAIGDLLAAPAAACGDRGCCERRS